MKKTIRLLLAGGAAVASVVVVGLAVFLVFSYTREPDLQLLEVTNTTGDELHVYGRGASIDFRCPARSSCRSPGRVYKGSVDSLRGFRRDSKDPIEPRQILRERRGRTVVNTLVF
jgi:hypothetical protein